MRDISTAPLQTEGHPPYPPTMAATKSWGRGRSPYMSRCYRAPPIRVPSGASGKGCVAIGQRSPPHRGQALAAPDQLLQPLGEPRGRGVHLLSKLTVRLR